MFTAANQSFTSGDFFGMFAFYNSLENSLFMLGHMSTTLSGAMVAMTYVSVMT